MQFKAFYILIALNSIISMNWTLIKMSTSKEQIKDLLEILQEGYTKRDAEYIEEFMKIYSKENTSLIIGTNQQEVFRGYDGAKELFLTDWKEWGDVKFDLETPDIQVMGDMAWVFMNADVKMTFPVFNALYDGAISYFKDDLSTDLRNSIIDGHIIAIDLSEPMDRIMDKDEDVEFLDDYRLMNPYILDIAREKISEGGESVLHAFEDGFKDARIGQLIDYKLKMKPESITDEHMIGCYKKYRSIMGTAGRNMAFNQAPLNEIYSLGMSKNRWHCGFC